VAGTAPWIGCAIGGAAITVYFTAGGLLTAAWVNVAQLAVKLVGFAVALPLALAAAGGWQGLSLVQPAENYWQFWRLSSPGVLTLAVIVPPFIVSPGLLQKIFGARDDRAVRVGVGLNALGLFAFAIVPALLGIVARSQFPSLGAPDAALPMILVHTLPPAVGAIGLAAVFSAEVSAADAVLFMLTTSLSQDLYKRFVDPGATDQRVLRVARWTAIAGGGAGTALAIALGSVVNALTIFYTLVGVSLFIPILAGLYVRRTSAAGALATMAAGVGAALALHVTTAGRGWGAVSPAIAGLAAAAGAWVITLVAFPRAKGRGQRA
jgi:SSS family solute:Na+ symporter